MKKIEVAISLIEFILIRKYLTYEELAERLHELGVEPIRSGRYHRNTVYRLRRDFYSLYSEEVARSFLNRNGLSDKFLKACQKSGIAPSQQEIDLFLIGEGFVNWLELAESDRKELIDLI